MADQAVHYCLFYDYVEDMLERRAPHREAHLAHLRAYRDAGKVIMAGALGEPPHGGLLVFRGVDPAEIEAFVGDDPYVRAGLVTLHEIERWNLV